MTSHFAAGPQAGWQGASDEQYPVRYVRSEQRSQRACGPQPLGARRRASNVRAMAPGRSVHTMSILCSPLTSARPALATKCEVIFAQALIISLRVSSLLCVLAVELESSIHREGAKKRRYAKDREAMGKLTQLPDPLEHPQIVSRYPHRNCGHLF